MLIMTDEVCVILECRVVELSFVFNNRVAMCISMHVTNLAEHIIYIFLGNYNACAIGVAFVGPRESPIYEQL